MYIYTVDIFKYPRRSSFIVKGCAFLENNLVYRSIFSHVYVKKYKIESIGKPVARKARLTTNMHYSKSYIQITIDN